MEASLINNLLSKHPYYSKLSDSDRLIVLNLALSNYWNALDEVIYPSVLTAGKVGTSGAIIEYPSIYRMPQRFSASLSLSTYSNILNQLSSNEYVGQLDDDSKKIVFSIAVQKLAQKIPSYYSVENHTGDIEYDTEKLISPLEVLWFKLPMINHYAPSISLSSTIVYAFSKFVDTIANITSSIAYVITENLAYNAEGSLQSSILYNMPIFTTNSSYAAPNSEIRYLVRTSADEPTEIIETSIALAKTTIIYSL